MISGKYVKTFTHNVSPISSSAEDAAECIIMQIARNFTESSDYRVLKVSTEQCDFHTAEIWYFLEPMIEDCDPLRGIDCILKEQSQKHLIITFGKSVQHADTQRLYARYLDRMPIAAHLFDVGTEIKNNPQNGYQNERADFTLSESQFLKPSQPADLLRRLIVGEVIWSESVEHALNKMMAQRYINEDIRLFILAFYIDKKDENDKPDGKYYHAVQFYKPVNTEGEAEGQRTTLEMQLGRTMLGQKYTKNGSDEAVEFPGMERGLEDGWDLCLVDQFVGLIDPNNDTPVKMKVIGPMTAEALASPLDLGEGSSHSKKYFSIKTATYLPSNRVVGRDVDCNLDMRKIFAAINIRKALWALVSENQRKKKSADPSPETEEVADYSSESLLDIPTDKVAIEDDRDVNMVNMVLDMYNANVADFPTRREFFDNGEASIDDAATESESNDVSCYMKRKIQEAEEEDRATAIAAVAELEAGPPGLAMKRLEEGLELHKTLCPGKRRKVSTPE